ncbi:MAG: multiheme c-type cytochrome [Candidatus Alcyoniella australis]|nr:multiheme c-type cytochrome [Candidatus Alcyoniella australis]
MRRWPSGLVLIVAMICAALFVQAQEAPQNTAPYSSNTQLCLDCHSLETPGIVQDWMHSRHARISPATALEQPVNQRRISAARVPDELENTAVGCYECHGLRADQHPDSVEHFGLRISSIVTPTDCAVCHPLELEQYAKSKMGNAWGNLAKNSLFTALVNTIDSPKRLREGELQQLTATDQTKAENCFACHGTKVTFTGTVAVQTDYGEQLRPQYVGWPSNGVGRINPDGSMGSCSSCHPRHGFSIEIARKPHTCGQCHLEPDVPAYNVYLESKHGNIYSSLKQDYDFDAVPWTVGRDFRAPTCAVCHASALQTPEGTLVVERTHDFGSRLWVRIFGLIYAHPQPVLGDTSKIRNADGLSLPTTFDNRPASGFLINEQTADQRQAQMQSLCSLCHGTTHVAGHFARLENTIAETDQMVATATGLMVHAWELGLADKTNPFDEALEIKWISQWLFYASSVRYASAMSGPDYAGFKNGWWYLSKNLREMDKQIKCSETKAK